MRRLFGFVIAAGLTLGLSTRASALTWPDAAERAARDLGSPDAAVRRGATERLRVIGASAVTPLLQRALGDPDVDVRIAAAHVAIAKHMGALTDTILPWLGERDPRLRIVACEVLRAIPDPTSTPHLARALSDADASVRAAAADALGEQASKEATPPLLGKLDDSSPVVRIQVVRALARLGDRRAVIPLIGKAQDSVPEVRQAVARALGTLGDIRAAPALVLELRDGSTDVKVAALTALGLLHAESAADAIAPLASDRNPLVRRAAIGALGRIASADAIRTLVGLLGTGDDATAGLETSGVREALSNAGRKAEAALLAVLSGTRPLAASSAAWVLAELGDSGATAELIRSMRRGTLPVTSLLHALAKLRSPEALEVVLEFVDDTSAAARKEALSAAGNILDPAHPDGRAVEPLEAALQGSVGQGPERARVAALLGRTGAPRAAPLLVSLARANSQRDGVVRLAAIDALGTLAALGGQNQADTVLLESMDDADPAVRLHAAVALGAVGGAAARDTLIRRLEKGSDLDRAATLTALGGIGARVPSEAAVATMARALDLTEGPRRDALILALGREDLPSAFPTILSLSRSPNPEDRRSVASVLAARHPNPATLGLLTTMLADADASVRAEAAWSLGEVGDASVIGALAKILEYPDVAPATNAVAAVGRILARTRVAAGGGAPPARAAAETPVGPLCTFLSDPRSQVRANAAVGLSLSRARCGDGATERHLLEKDVAVVRASAARAIATEPLGPPDAAALDRCRTSDPSGVVARECRPRLANAESRESLHSSTAPVEIYVEDALGTEPRPGTPFVAEFADGLLRAGRTDRRGAFFDAAAPPGEVSLLSVNPGTP